MKIKELLRDATHRFQAAGIPDAQTDALLLLGHVLGMGRTQLYLHAEQEVDPKAAALFGEYVERRLGRVPVAYILEEQEFWSLPFSVSPDVLIPRPETEELLENILATVAEHVLPEGLLLDLGVGSGAITVVLAREFAGSSVIGVDRSLAALRVARKNICRHGVEARVSLVNADWLSAIVARPRFSLVVSNPPYIAQPALAGLQPEVREHEPHLALTSGESGLEAISTLARQVKEVLRPEGWFFMEIGADQRDSVLNLFASLPEYDSLDVLPDLAGLPRIFKARRTA